MLEKLIQKMENLQNSRVSIVIEKDIDGFLDKECPSEKCMFQFKVLADDWHKNINQDKVFCPMCRQEDSKQKWHTTEQRINARNQAINHVKSIINNAIIHGIDEYDKQGGSNEFVRLNVVYSENPEPIYYFVPIETKNRFQLQIECENCKSNFAVVGSAFFALAVVIIQLKKLLKML